MTQYTGLKLEKQNHTAIITLDNPPAHTWTVESLKALSQLIKDLNQDSENYALIITGAGEKFFSAGADLKLFANGDKALAQAMAIEFGRAFETLAEYKGISIAAINGYAMGGGLECALACDIRIAEEQAQMALPETSVGLLPCAGGTQWLAWNVGESWAKRLIMLGEKITAQKAKEIGLIQEIVEKGSALQAAKELAAKAAKNSPLAAQKCKKLINAARNQPPQTALFAERQAFIELFDTQDQKEGVGAFLEKRAPNWSGK